MQGNNLIINDSPVESVFFPQSLTVMKNRDYNIKYGELSAFRLIPVDRTTSPWADFVGYNQYDMRGEAKIIATKARDLPMSDVVGKQFFNPIAIIGGAYEYSFIEIQKAQFAGIPMKENKRKSTEQSHLNTVNNLAFNGNTEAGIVGWLDVPTINKVPVSGANATARKWFGTGATKTPQQIIADLNEAYNYVFVGTKGRTKPNTIAMGLQAALYLKQTPYNTATPLVSILDVWLDSLDSQMNVEVANELDNAFPGATNGFIIYQKDIENFWLELPMLFREETPTYNINNWIFPSYSACGGVTVPYPMTQAMRYGI